MTGYNQHPWPPEEVKRGAFTYKKKKESVVDMICSGVPLMSNHGDSITNIQESAQETPSFDN